ncbi:MAG: DUF983 domain-containing protein [Bacteroidota bacterium]|nr:DUF983 domain-containing protein [Bacteroidota bacterium]MDP4236474.1 DUF983 domain-containing protein [Bacteroidota bacterium]
MKLILHRDLPPSLRDQPLEASSHLPPHNVDPVANIKEAISCGMKRICPACKNGKMFRTYFQMNDYCPTCGVKYEREAGEFIVAMYINIFLTEILFISGYLLTNSLFSWGVWTQVAIWAPFNALFPIWFYPRSKGLWAAGLQLSTGLYKD